MTEVIDEYGNVPETYQLIYFNFRGVAEPARLILKLKGVPFDDVRLQKDETWISEHKQKCPYGVLPVLKINGFELSQSAAIARYLARKYDLVGANEMESALCDELVESMVDLRAFWKPYWREADVSKKESFKDALLKTHFPYYFEKYSKILEGNGGDWLASESLTWADLYIAHFLEFFELTVDPNILNDFPALRKLQENVFSIPEIKAWVQARPKTVL